MQLNDLNPEMQAAIAVVHGALKEHAALPVGAVVRVVGTPHFQIGVVIGVEAPERFDEPWSYEVYFFDNDYPLEAMYSERRSHYGDELEVVEVQSPDRKDSPIV